MRYVIVITALMCLCGFEALLLADQSDANRSQARTLVCFDGHNRPTMAATFKECRLVAIRELT